MKYLSDVWPWDSTTFLSQNAFIQRNNLGYIRNRILSQSRQPFFSMTFPGAVAHFRLLVSGMHTTENILLSLNGFPCITSIGRRNPGPDPDGSDKSAHHTSPWRISTIRFVQADCETLSVWKSRPHRWLFQVFRSASWWFHRVRVFPDIQPSLQKKADYATCAYVSHAFQRPGIPNPGLKLQFWSRKYTPPRSCDVK